MNGIYNDTFVVTQKQHKGHRGMDLVGIKNKKIFSNVPGTIEKLGWENPNNKKQGFGLRLWIKGDDGMHYVFGHLNYIQEDFVVGDRIEKGTYIGQEGSTGCSTGSHCHYEVRKSITSNVSENAFEYLGIPNIEGKIENTKDIVKRYFSDFGNEFWEHIDHYQVNGVNYSKEVYEKLIKYIK